MKKEEKNEDELLREQFQKLADGLQKVIPYFLELHDMPVRDEEEEAEYQKLKLMIVKAYNVVDQMKDIVGERLFARSLEIYYHWKKLAAEGNEDAKKLYEELKPKLKDALNEQLEGSEN